jgi:hypothetical protein
MARNPDSSLAGRGSRPQVVRRQPGVRRLILVGSLLLVSLPIPTTGEPAARTDTERLLQAAFEHWVGQEARLQEISQRIRVAGRDLCGAGLTPVLGAAVLGPDDLHPPLDAMLRRRLGDLDGLYVAAVFPDMAAARAGMRSGDAITRIGYHPARETHQFYSPAVETNQVLVIEIDRDGERQSLEVERNPGCAYAARLILDDVVSAYADGWTINFTTGLMRIIENDVQLATIVGHEIAHNIDLRNRRGTVSRQVRREERADYIGIYLAAIAGYLPEVEDARVELDLMSNVHYVTMRRSHPSTPERVLAFRKTLEEIAAKRQRGEALVLELR